MAKPDGRIEKGQRLSTAISARAWNRAQDAADIVLGVRPGVTAEPVISERSYNWIRVFNNGGSGPEYTIPRWGPVIISYGLSRDGHYGAEGEFFEDEPLLVGYRTLAPDGSSNLQGAIDPVFWGIAIEPIAVGTIGRVAISGVVQCKLNVRSETDTCATIRGADEQNLLTGHSGEAVILHRDAGTGPGKWGLIKFGHQNTVRRATISTTWQYNTSRELTDDDGNAFTATNFCQTLTVPLVVGSIQVLTSRWVYCSFVHDSWQLISWQSHLATPASLPQNTAIVPV